MSELGVGVQSTWWPPRGAAQTTGRYYRVGASKPGVEIVMSPDIATLTAERDQARRERDAWQRRAERWKEAARMYRTEAQRNHVMVEEAYDEIARLDPS